MAKIRPRRPATEKTAGENSVRIIGEKLARMTPPVNGQVIVEWATAAGIVACELELLLKGRKVK